jgi:CubicO group peptidase (beta-lactamase class C family)
MGILPRIVTRAPVPKYLGDVTTIADRSEVPPHELGVTRDGVESIWRAVERVYRSGLHPAIQLCVRRRGEILIDRAIGYAKGGGPNDRQGEPKTACTTETPFNVFSASKAVTAMLIHLLDQKHLIHLDDPVCEYIPEFGVHGKQWITIRHVLTHRSGIPNIPSDAMDVALLERPYEITKLLCECEPTWRAGRQLAYHAISGGFVLGEIVHRVTGEDIRTLLDDAIVSPLGFRWMNYGVAPEDVGAVALNYFTGPPILPPLSMLLRRALGVGFEHAAELSNDPRFLNGIVPAGNLVATANEMSRFYQLLLNGGELDGVRVFEPRTVRRATSEQSYLELDLTLGIPVRYGMGFMLGGEWFSLFGPNSRYAFGHLGFTNIVSWADPERQVAAALMTSGKPFIYPELIHFLDVLRRIGSACPKEADMDWWTAVSGNSRDSAAERRVGS